MGYDKDEKQAASGTSRRERAMSASKDAHLNSEETLRRLARTRGSAIALTEGDVWEVFDSAADRGVTGVGPTGDPYVDSGSICEGGGTDCFLTDGQRSRLVAKFQMRMHEASDHYKHAAAVIRVDKLIERDDAEIPWVASLLLDIATAHLTSLITSSLTALRALDNRRLELHAKRENLMIPQHTPSWGVRARSALLQVNEKTTNATVKATMDAGKKLVVAVGKEVLNASDTTAKAESLSFLDQLTSATSLAYTYARETLPGTATDAELLTFCEALAPENHLIVHYKAALAAKLARYHASGVTKIGRRYETRESFVDEMKLVGGDTPVVRDVRVVWREYLSGHPRQLAYEHHDGDHSPGTIRRDEPGSPSHQLPMVYRPRRPVTAAPEPRLSNDPEALLFVPDEFVDYALQRHVQMWGSVPATVTIDDSGFYWDPERAARAAARRPARSRPPDSGMQTTTPQVGSPIVIPDALKLQPGHTP